MKNLLTLQRFAIVLPGTPINGPRGGCFDIPSPGTGAVLRVIATSGLGWDHASVSTPKRCPNWTEMCLIKDLFWEEEDMVMQVHPPKSEWISVHPFCLHLWRPLDPGVRIPKPPAEFVGVQGMSAEEARKMTPASRVALQLKLADSYAARRANGNG